MGSQLWLQPEGLRLPVLVYMQHHLHSTLIDCPALRVCAPVALLLALAHVK